MSADADIKISARSALVLEGDVRIEGAPRPVSRCCLYYFRMAFLLTFACLLSHVDFFCERWRWLGMFQFGVVSFCVCKGLCLSRIVAFEGSAQQRPVANRQA